jgi:hypothetical protein
MYAANGGTKKEGDRHATRAVAEVMHVRSADPIAVLVKEVQLKHGISKYFIMQRHGAQAAGRRRERKASGRRAGAETAQVSGPLSVHAPTSSSATQLRGAP